MLITLHGRKHRFYKGVSAFKGPNGKPLVFFGWSFGQVERKEAEWLELNKPVSEVRECVVPTRDAGRPSLRVVG
jgi:hypothetical protein